MSHPRRNRWFHRIAFGLVVASVVVAGSASAMIDPGTHGSQHVTAGGWSGEVDLESGIPLSAGIPHGDEQFIDDQAIEVIPYLPHGILTQAEADATAVQARPGIGQIRTFWRSYGVCTTRSTEEVSGPTHL